MNNRPLIRIRPLALPGLCLLEPAVSLQPGARFSYFHDERDQAALGLPPVVQQHASFYERHHTVRGLHYQDLPHPQTKIVSVARGRIHDVVVDIRRGSPSFGHHIAIELRADWARLVVPPGFAHGFCTLEPDTEVVFALSDYNRPPLLRGLRWDDPALAIDWPCGATPAKLFEVDLRWPGLVALPTPFGV